MAKLIEKDLRMKRKASNNPEDIVKEMLELAKLGENYRDNGQFRNLYDALENEHSMSRNDIADLYNRVNFGKTIPDDPGTFIMP